MVELTIPALPGNYNFEIHKTIHHVRRDGAKTVALQMPEGLMMYGCAIADIIERYVRAKAELTYQLHGRSAVAACGCHVRSMLYRRLYGKGDGSGNDCPLRSLLSK
jgi:diphthamide synthase subunit DPH2